MILKKIIQINSVFIISFIVMLSFYLYTPIKSAQVVYVPSGSLSYIIQTFIDKGYELNRLDKYFLYFLGYPQKGFIDLGGVEFSRIEFLHKLVTSKGAMVDIIALPGESTYYFLQQISHKLNLDSSLLHQEYIKQAVFLDGVILGDTYKINMNMNEREVIGFLISHSMSKHARLSNKYLGSYNKKQWFRYITIASIIQKEAASNKEMGLISSVIYNRIRKSMYLQMDGALNYGKYAHTKVTKKRIKSDKTRFNTYRYKGVPPYPVSIVSVDAIKHAIYPKKSNYLYFVLDLKTNKHTFTTSYDEHIKYVKRLKRIKYYRKTKKKEDY